MSNFRVGQKVVCIRDGYAPPNFPGPIAVTGKIYTIDDIKDASYVRMLTLHQTYDGDYLRMCELGNTYAHHSLFRPLVDRPTSIELFHRMLLNDEQRNRRELERLNEERGAPMELPLW